MTPDPAAPPVDPDPAAPDPPAAAVLDEDKAESLIRKVLGDLIGTGDLVVDPDPAAPDPPAGTQTLRQEEAGWEERVKALLAAHEHEQAHDKDHELLRQIAEAPPRTVRRLTRWMWGEPD